LKAECITLERDVLRRTLATEQELAPFRPGKESNTQRDARGWLRYFARLHRFHARGENSDSDEARARADAQVLAALRDEAIRVDLLQPITLLPIADEEPESPIDHLYVYQKSLDALLHAHALDRQLAWLILQKERVEEAGARGMPRSSELLDKVMETISYTYGLIVWIFTSAGPAMPYALNGKTDPVLPPEIVQLHPLDVAQIANAAMKHHARLAALQVLLDRKSRRDGGRRPSWSQFIGSLAVEMGVDSVQIMKHRSLGSLLASVQLNADANTPDDDPAAATRPTAGTLT
jgi:hypothetical protein